MNTVKTPQFILDRKGKALYIPAYSATGLEMLEKNLKHKISGKSFRFYCEKEDRLFGYEGFLTSAGHHYKWMTFKDDMKVDLDKVFLFGDSGGFQIATDYLDCSTPEKNDAVRSGIFQWLEANTNYAVNIDYPMYAPSKRYDREYKIAQSDKNFEYFAQNQSGSTRYVNVLHGRNQKDLDDWFAIASKYSFTGGWALGSVSRSIFWILQSFFYLLQKKELEKISGTGSIVHILGFSKIREMKFIIYLQEMLNNIGLDINITFDSSAPDIRAGFGSYSSFVSRSGIEDMNMGKGITLPKNSYLPCHCPVCEKTTFEDYFGQNQRNKNGGFKTETYNFMSLHNLYRLLEYKEFLERTIKTQDKLLIRSISNENEFAIYDYIEQAMNSKKPFDFIVEKESRIVKSLEKADRKNLAEVTFDTNALFGSTQNPKTKETIKAIGTVDSRESEDELSDEVLKTRI